MIKIVWRGYLYQNNKSPFIEVGNGQTLKLQGNGVGNAIVKGYLTSDSSPTPIALVRAKDLATRKKVLTDNIYSADVSGYEYITVTSTGFKSIYGVIYGDEDDTEYIEGDTHVYNETIILDEYKQTIKINYRGE